jgi:hypothetical protein
LLQVYREERKNGYIFEKGILGDGAGVGVADCYAEFADLLRVPD